MELPAGTRLGAYRIEGPLGAGGMGRVYRATHVELGRSVAIKMVADDVARNPVALARFRREARAASRLSHPHVCTVHDFAEEGGRPFLVLELVPGETLEERLRRGPLAVRDVLRLGGDVAEALAHAHGRGLVHRDLKPGNVMLTDAGAKVLDFGLAKAARSGDEDEPPGSLATVTAEASVPGTVPYMAPEQLDGKTSDARADVWALGVVLYEMLAGRRPFTGSTSATLAAAILAASPPPLASLRPDVPRALVRIVERCLERRPERRFQSAHDVALALRWLEDDLDEGGLPTAAAGVARRRARGWRRPAAVAGAVTLGLAGVLATVVALLSDPPGAEPVTFSLNPPPGVRFTEGSRNVPAVSPDGDRIAFVATDSGGASRLWLRALAEARARPVGGPQDALRPFWSPDGSTLGFFTLETLGILPVEGGPPRRLADVTMESRGASWGPEGILFAAGSDGGLRLVDPDGGAARTITTPDRERGEVGHYWPDFLPDGERFLYYVASPVDSVRGIYLASLAAPRGRRLTASEASGRNANGHLLYLLQGDLVAQRLDAGAGRLLGEPQLVAPDVAATDAFEGAFAASRNGVLAYASRSGKNLSRLVAIDREGRDGAPISEPGDRRNPTVSPDGTQVAVDAYSGADSRVEVVDLSTGRSRPVGVRIQGARNAVWSPEGRELAFAASGPDGWSVFVVGLDRTEAPRRVFRHGSTVMPTSWSPDGEALAANVLGEAGRNFDVWLLPAAPDGEAAPLLASEANEVSLRFSPDGRRVAYVSDETGRAEVYAQPHPPTGARCQISAGGGWDPVWGSDGDQLHFLGDDGALFVADLPSDPRACPGAEPRSMFRTGVTTPGTSRNHFAVLPDGRILLNRRIDDPTAPELQLVLNWTAGVE